jgi:hypothetical protein
VYDNIIVGLKEDKMWCLQQTLETGTSFSVPYAAVLLFWPSYPILGYYLIVAAMHGY